MARAAKVSADTSQRILDAAERLVQTLGFNGFSYADIAAALAITKASLHYHFPTKAELGARLIERYERRFLDALDAIDRSGVDAREKLRRYAAIYMGVLRSNRMCLCGMLASDYATLAKPVKDGVKRFFNRNEDWLVAVLEQGRASGTLRFAGSPDVVARGIVGALEGAMMLARSYGEFAHFEAVADRLIAEL
jgi:TetR/AcrR family transcriptional regulator, transcriptional repressor for nem operon